MCVHVAVCLSDLCAGSSVFEWCVCAGSSVFE